MHPVLFEIGSFPLGTYGLLLAIAFFAGTALAKRQAKLDGLNPAAITDMAIAVLIAAIVGSKLLMIVVGLFTPAGQEGAMTFREVFTMSTLRAGGAIHGGIIAATATFFWKLRKGQGLPLRLTGDALVPGVALGQAIGRLGCFSAGCCYGTETHVAWAATFTDPIAHAFSGTPLDVPLHPVQLYNSLANLTVMAILLLARGKRRFQGQIFSLYFLVEGLGRIVTETWRGDVDRGTGWLGWAWLSTGRLTGVAFMMLGLGLWLFWSRRKEATR
ncbi:prolipoprotein diacylglyceryl transferase [Geothrix terrae]|uniref:prolipoprotein diacylglyceryl transferase n=1 Tax=Geothrix terrae TaxID=2922720 RepID=UPI001FAE4CE3|nr:prolipoprotein diacylglyceryl transferase [Geothrix terrae]